MRNPETAVIFLVSEKLHTRIKTPDPEESTVHLMGTVAYGLPVTFRSHLSGYVRTGRDLRRPPVV